MAGDEQDLTDAVQGAVTREARGYTVQTGGHLFDAHKLEEFVMRAGFTRRAVTRGIDDPCSERIRNLLSSMPCYTCAEYVPADLVNDVMIVAQTICAFPVGAITQFELAVPSGQIVIANDLRQWFELPNDEDFNINCLKGVYDCILAYAEIGMAHGFVGNTCPGVYRLPGDKYTISSGNYTTDRYDTSGPGFELEPGGVRLASVTTDLWWYSIVDGADAVARGVINDENPRDYTIVDVRPGIYQFNHYTTLLSWRDTLESIGAVPLYADFTWVREA